MPLKMNWRLLALNFSLSPFSRARPYYVLPSLPGLLAPRHYGTRTVGFLGGFALFTAILIFI